MTQQTQTPIEQLSDMIYGYPEYRLRYMNRSLVWSESGLARAGSILGYIIGMRDGGNPEFAEQLAEDFLRNLERLVPDHHKIPVEEGSKHMVPATICEIRDDGTFHGFSLAWYVFNRELLGCAQPAERCIDWGIHPKCEYRFAYNGGLIYHGPRAGQTFSVTIEPCLWGIHT
jgi:hypothetical protein